METALKRKKEKQKTLRTEARSVFLMVGDNRIELVSQRTCLEGARATRKT